LTSSWRVFNGDRPASVAALRRSALIGLNRRVGDFPRCRAGRSALEGGRACADPAAVDTSLPVADPVDVGHYVSWGAVQISVANLAIVAVMLVVFVVAVVMPLRRGRGPEDGDGQR